MPKPFFEYSNFQASKMAESISNVSDTQQEKIDQAFWKNIDKLAASDSFKAIEHDVRLSGDAAFSTRKSKS